MKSVKEMNGIERIAYKNIKGVFEWDVDEWYNLLQDGYEDEIPTLDEAKVIVYEDSLIHYAEPGHLHAHHAPKEMRLAGKEFIMSVIDYLFDNNEDAIELWGN